jgi:predicted O-methyltransferase YrrM
MRAAPGFLTEREGRFLALLAAGTPAAGTILEIGTFKGKSTVGLATIARHYGLGPVVTVDPHTAPAPTDPDLAGQASSWEAFTGAVQAAGVADAVEAHRAYSRDLAPAWTRPIRFLWIDGDHTYAGTHEDLALFGPHLVPGGVVAFHDVLHAYEGPVRVFVEEVLRSDRFGPAGVCGSIGWAQYRPADGAAFRGERLALAVRLGRLIALVRDGRRPRGLARLWYQALRAAVPHAAPESAAWLARVALPASGPRGILGHA